MMPITNLFNVGIKILKFMEILSNGNTNKYRLIFMLAGKPIL